MDKSFKVLTCKSFLLNAGSTCGIIGNSTEGNLL